MPTGRRREEFTITDDGIFCIRTLNKVGVGGFSLTLPKFIIAYLKWTENTNIIAKLKHNQKQVVLYKKEVKALTAGRQNEELELTDDGIVYTRTLNRTGGLTLPIVFIRYLDWANDTPLLISLNQKQKQITISKKEVK